MPNEEKGKTDLSTINHTDVLPLTCKTLFTHRRLVAGRWPPTKATNEMLVNRKSQAVTWSDLSVLLVSHTVLQMCQSSKVTSHCSQTGKNLRGDKRTREVSLCVSSLKKVKDFKQEEVPQTFVFLYL